MARQAKDKGGYDMTRIAGAWKFLVRMGPWLLAATLLHAQEARLGVRHDHLLGSCRGELVFGQEAVEYRTAHTKHARTWKYEDIQQLGFLGPASIALLTYEDARWMLGKDRSFRFELLDGEIPAALVAALRDRLSRPLVSALLPADTGAKYRIAAKHLKGFGGTSGILEIGEDAVAYRTEAKGDSRLWRYRDIVSIGTTGPYQLRLMAMDRVDGEFAGERNFVFSLKERLGEEIYDFLWWKINGPKVSSGAGKR